MSPKRTTPSASEMVAGSFGLRASNNSATRGRPPVMSRVLYASRLIFAMIVPGVTLIAIVDDQLRTDGDHEVADTLIRTTLRAPDFDVRMQLLLAIIDDDALA